MTTLGGRYLNPHRSQYDADSPPRTRQEGCVPTTGANGANAASRGRVNRTGAQVHALIPKAQETSPSTPGWSQTDLHRAMVKLGVPYESRAGQGWAAVIAASDAGLYVALAGDSDQFGNSTCSGEYDGPHTIGIHPAKRLVDNRRQRWIDDPICRTGRWEYEATIHRYADKLQPTIMFGVFTSPVPKVAPAAVTVTLRYGGKKLNPRQGKRIRVPSGRRANVRSRPTTAARIVTSMANGQTFTAYQRTATGQLLAGSRVWYGDRTGTRWLHISAF